MSDSPRNDVSLPSQHPSQQALPEPSLEALALAEWLAEQRAAGDIPRLTALIAGLPHAAGALADAVMAESDERADDMGAVDDSVSGRSEPIPLSPGTQRGVVALFGLGEVSSLEAYEEFRAAEAHDDGSFARVAEAPGLYRAVTDEDTGVLALASQRGLDAEALAAQVMLSLEALHWLDRIALPPERQPDALVFHLAGALGVTGERIREALAQGQTDTETPDVVGVLTTSPSLAVAQRNYWAALLSSSE